MTHLLSCMHAFLTSSIEPHTWQNWLLLQGMSCPLMSMSTRGFMLMQAYSAAQHNSMGGGMGWGGGGCCCCCSSRAITAAAADASHVAVVAAIDAAGNFVAYAAVRHTGAAAAVTYICSCCDIHIEHVGTPHCTCPPASLAPPPPAYNHTSTEPPGPHTHACTHPIPYLHH